jgi:hypothetical protein
MHIIEINKNQRKSTKIEDCGSLLWSYFSRYFPNLKTLNFALFGRIQGFGLESGSQKGSYVN